MMKFFGEKRQKTGIFVHTIHKGGTRSHLGKLMTEKLFETQIEVKLKRKKKMKSRKNYQCFIIKWIKMKLLIAIY